MLLGMAHPSFLPFVTPVYVETSTTGPGAAHNREREYGTETPLDKTHAIKRGDGWERKRDNGEEKWQVLDNHKWETGKSAAVTLTRYRLMTQNAGQEMKGNLGCIAALQLSCC